MNIQFNSVNDCNKLNRISNLSKAVSKNTVVDFPSSAMRNDVISISADAVDYSKISDIKKSITSNATNYNDTEKIDSLKKLISDDKYSVSSKDIADKILERLAW